MAVNTSEVLWQDYLMDFVIVEQYNAILLLVWLPFVIIFSLLSKLCNTHGLYK